MDQFWKPPKDTEDAIKQGNDRIAAKKAKRKKAMAEVLSAVVAML